MSERAQLLLYRLAVGYDIFLWIGQGGQAIKKHTSNGSMLGAGLGIAGGVSSTFYI
jgi:hypothetical protein